MSDEPGERIRAAVLAYLSDHPDALTETEATVVRDGEAFREDDGTVRIGSWRLEERDGDPVLVRQRGGPSRLTVVRLDDSDGDWQVTGVDDEHYSFG